MFFYKYLDTPKVKQQHPKHFIPRCLNNFVISIFHYPYGTSKRLQPFWKLYLELKSQTTKSFKSCSKMCISTSYGCRNLTLVFTLLESARPEHQALSYGFGTTITFCSNKVCALWSKLPRITPLLWHKPTHLVEIKGCSFAPFSFDFFFFLR